MEPLLLACFQKDPIEGKDLAFDLEQKVRSLLFVRVTKRGNIMILNDRKEEGRSS